MNNLLNILIKSNNYKNSYIEKFFTEYGYNNFREDIKYNHLEKFLIDNGIVIKIANDGSIDRFSVVNGPGIRYTIFTQGCIHNCDGCHNVQTHNFDSSGEFISVEDLFEDIKNVSNIIKGITLTGGDPLFYKNYNGILKLCKMIKEKLRNLDIWLYTGYTFENLYDKEILKYVDVIVDGKFIKELKSYDLKYKGSSNQRIIDINKSIVENKIVLWENDNEYYV